MEEPNRSARMRLTHTPPLRTVFRRLPVLALGPLRPNRTSLPCNLFGRRMLQESCRLRHRHCCCIRARDTQVAESETRKVKVTVVSSWQISLARTHHTAKVFESLLPGGGRSGQGCPPHEMRPISRPVGFEVFVPDSPNGDDSIVGWRPASCRPSVACG